MVQRFNVSSPLTSDAVGSMVAYEDYENLLALLRETLNDAERYFEMAAAGEVTATGANAALRVSVRLAGIET